MYPIVHDSNSEESFHARLLSSTYYSEFAEDTHN